MLGAGYPLLDVFISTLYAVLFVLWIMLVFHIMTDIFASHDLGGPQKALWVLIIMALPLIGGLVYLAARGGSMHERESRASQAPQRVFEDYIREVANTKE
jgi:hypothetical protein